MFDLLPHELIVDNFAGGGGASTGLEQFFKRPIDIAINHDPKALAMHRINHPKTVHYCESVWVVDPKKITNNQPVGLVWLSPDCRHFSKAKGGKPASKSVRGLAWVALRWAATTRPRVIILENVEEFRTWGDLDASGRPCPKNIGRTFNCFVNALKYQGYTVEYRELRACDFGAPTIRKRFFLIARRDGLKIKWPKPTHGRPEAIAVKRGYLKPYLTAADCIDWTIPIPSIFNRKRPLVDATMSRIWNGLRKQVFESTSPFIVKGSIAPIMTECANASSPRCMPADEPLRTILAQTKGGHHAIIATKLGEVDEALNERHQEKLYAFLTAHYGNDRTGNSLHEPLRTISAKSHLGLVAVNGTWKKITDIGFRMLQPKELFKAQGFPVDYIYTHGLDENGVEVKLTKTEQNRMVGNSVSPPMSYSLASANFEHEKIIHGAA